MSDVKPRRKKILGIESPWWLCKARRNLLDALPKVYGPRGMVMLGKALICASFGVAYIGVINVPMSPGLEMVSRLLPLPFWAVAWFLCAFMLTASAFRVDQSRALGCTAGMLSLWALSYLEYFIRVPVLPSGQQNLAFLSAVLLLSIALSTAGIARMLNTAPSHPEIVQKPGDSSE